MLVVPQWDFDFPGRDRLKDGYKALTARPFLPRYFPGFDLYLWIDGRLLGAAGRRDRAVPRRRPHRRAGRGAGDPPLDAPLPSCLGRVLGRLTARPTKPASTRQTAERLIRYPLINAGVFALKADAPHWQGWAAICSARRCSARPT